MVEPQQNLGDRSVQEEIAAYLQAYQDTGYFMGSVLIGCGGKVLFSKGYGMANLEHNIPNTPKTKFRLGSVTKQFTAAAILKLQEQNLLDVNQTITSYLPDYPHPEITIHQLLNHSAGIPNYTSFEDFAAKKAIALQLDKLIAWFSDRPLEFTPGEMFSYSNSGYVMLTKIIETVSNQPYADYLQQHIFQPLGMSNSGYDRHGTILPHRAAGYAFTGEEYHNAPFIDMSLPSGAGALYSTVEDIYLWERSLFTDRVLNQASRDAMFASTINVPTDENELASYGYGWFIDTQHNCDRISHDGGIDGFRSHFARYPQAETAIIILSNLQTSPLAKMGRDIAAILWGKSDEIPQVRKAIAVEPAIYETYVGEYKLESSTPLPPAIGERIFTVTTDSQRLFTQITGQEVVEIFPESPTQFFPKVIDAQITFVTNENGTVSQLILHQNGRDTILHKIN